MVVNLDDSKNPGSHWIALFFPNKKHAYYFDSFGLDAQGPIAEYLQKFNYITRQIATIQSIGSDACGYYAIYFVYLSSLGVPYVEINKRLARAKNPDVHVRDFVNKYVRSFAR